MPSGSSRRQDGQVNRQDDAVLYGHFPGSELYSVRGAPSLEPGSPSRSLVPGQRSGSSWGDFSGKPSAAMIQEA